MSSEKMMKSIGRPSISEDFTPWTDSPMPALPKGGAIVKVYYAGACYSDGQLVNSNQQKPRLQGIHDTSLFPGYEMSGVVDAVCPTVTNCPARIGDRVIVYPSDDEELTNIGYAEYVVVKDAANLIPLPDYLPLDVAAILPCGALSAYAAVERVKSFIDHKISTTNDVVNLMIVGAGGLGLWTLRLAEHYISSLSSTRVRIIVADHSVGHLTLAKEHGCYDTIHCDDSVYEEYIVMRIKNVCKGGVDAVIDFVSSARTVDRSVQVLKEGGVVIVGGNSKQEVPVKLHSLAMRGQSIVGVHRGSRDQLAQLVQLVAEGEIKPPVFSVYPVEEANTVFTCLSHSEISGRAVLRVCSRNDADYDSVFFSSKSLDRLPRAPSSTPSSPEPMSPSSAPNPRSGFFLPDA